MSRRPQPTRSRDGQHRLTIRVEHRLTRKQLISAVMVCAELSADPAGYAERPVAQIRADVADLLRTDGRNMGLVDGLSTEDMAGAIARAEAIVAKAYPPFPLDPPPRREPGRLLEVRPTGHGIDLVPVDDGPPPTFEWPPPDRPTLDELPPEPDDGRAALGAALTPPED